MALAENDPIWIAAATLMGKVETSKLPIAALEVSSLMLTLFKGDAELAVLVLNQVAQTDFGLVINGEGKIALPQKVVAKHEEKLIFYYKKDPRVIDTGIPPLAYNRPYRKTPDRKGGAE